MITNYFTYTEEDVLKFENRPYICFPTKKELESYNEIDYPSSPYYPDGIYGFYGDNKNGPENFQGINEYAFLSNTVTLETRCKPIIHERIVYYSVEAFYQAMKTLNTDLRKKIASVNIKNVNSIRSIQFTPRSGWSTGTKQFRFIVLLYGLREKFKYYTIRSSDDQEHINRFWKLLESTGDKYIEETNWWNDKIFGVYNKTKRGFNILGYMLMHVRYENRLKRKIPFWYKFNDIEIFIP